MRCVLSGKNGFIGQHLAKRLEKEGHSVYSYERGSHLASIEEINPQIIFHLAAELTDPNKMFDSNVKLTHDLLEATKAIDYHSFIYVGSSSEYGRKTRPIKESDALVPETLYEATKGAASLLSQAYASVYDKPIAIARPFSVFGPGEPQRKFMPAIYNAYKTKTPLTLGHGYHDWIYIDDFINGLMLLVGKRAVVNFGSGIQTSNQEVVTIFEDIVGEKIETIPGNKLRAYDSDCWVCDTTFAREFLGFRCRYTLREGLVKCVEYFAKT